MYKRYAKELNKTREDSSSESDSEQQEALLASQSNDDGSNAGSSDEVNDILSEESDGIIEESVLTMEELEAGDSKVARKPKKHEILLYQCSLCPEKRLTTLSEVQEHIISKVRHQFSAL
jgi:5-methylcytosine-specific restriction endonuclease McrA